MIKSMTGFGRSEYSDGKRSIIVEIRAVNHRYCDINVKMARRYSFAEDKIKTMIKETISRGKLDVSVMVENVTEDDMTVKLNTMVAHQYRENLEILKKEFELQGDISLEFMATLPDVMKAVPDVEDEEEFLKELKIPVKMSVEKLDAMRSDEGQKLAEDLIMRGKMIRGLVEKIEARAPQIVTAYKEKLTERIQELLDKKVEVPEERIAMEVAVFADKCSITEELVRLDSHMLQMNKILTESKQPVGKKLDFLVQEMNREANTIGSKANDIDTTNLMLEIKSEIEKIREQVQNIE